MGDIEDELTTFVIEQLQFFRHMNNEPITICINSHGGCVDCETAIVDEIILAKEHGITVKTVVLGVAYSAAASILALGSCYL